MKEILKKIKADTILSAVLCIILGVVLLLYTEQMTDLLCKLLAVVLIVMGVAHMIIYFTDRVGNNLRLIGGVVVLLLGVWIFINPRIIINLIPAIIGAILFLHGVEDLRLSIQAKQAEGSAWISCLILAIVNLAIGILLIVKAFEAAQIAFKLIGIALIYDGISDIWIVSRAVKAAKQMEQDLNAIDTEEKEL
ncbi:putative uncharacterized protein [Roseburia sp. CAG:182]|nr:putative uncharacterized protein [Roseburia sp. CAG:182]